MKIKEIRRLSYFIISEYYNNNLTPFFEYLDENITWYGPREGQIIISKKNMIEAWKKEKHQLKFTMSDSKQRVVIINKNAYSVILSYYVYTHYPNGVNHVHNQNVDMTWIERKITDENGNMIKKPFIIKMFFSNVQQKHENDNIYAIHGEKETFKHFDVALSKRLILKSTNKTINYILSNNIIWIEKSGEGRHSTVHTVTDATEYIEKTDDILKQSNNLFLSPHKSYLINPLYVSKVERFKLTLTDGTVLPIAEKKYTKFKNDLKNWKLNKKN